MILDNHTLLWVDRNDSKLGAMARLQIEVAWRAGLLVVSAISFREVAMLAERDLDALPLLISSSKAFGFELLSLKF